MVAHLAPLLVYKLIYIGEKTNEHIILIIKTYIHTFRKINYLSMYNLIT
jgi:hypothetical protein